MDDIDDFNIDNKLNECGDNDLLFVLTNTKVSNEISGRGNVEVIEFVNAFDGNVEESDEYGSLYLDIDRKTYDIGYGLQYCGVV